MCCIRFRYLYTFPVFVYVSGICIRFRYLYTAGIRPGSGRAGIRPGRPGRPDLKAFIEAPSGMFFFFLKKHVPGILDMPKCQKVTK